MNLLLRRGSVGWAQLPPARGREQSGGQPFVVVASDGYLDVVTTLVIVLSVTSVDRGWPSHVPLSGAHGLDRPSHVMTEQPRTIARERIVEVTGMVDRDCLTAIDIWLRDFLDI